MSQDTVSMDIALENVLIMAERLAFLHYAYAKTLENELSAASAEKIIFKVIDEYGELVAKSVTEKLDAQNLEPTLSNYSLGKDLPSIGWQVEPFHKREGETSGKISRVTFCPLAETWKRLGADGQRLGRLYCHIDQAKYKLYGKGYACFHDENVLDGGSCCLIRVETNDLTDSQLNRE